MCKVPFIYVVIPVYKAEKYIAQTLDSVLAQPYPNIRIVCVDDGSPDDSIRILRDYEKHYENIRVIRQENGGVSKARNAGIEYVCGQCREDDYIAFLDADDCWVRNAVTQDLVSRFEGADCIGLTSVGCSEDLSRTAAVMPLTAAVCSGGRESRWCHSDYHFAAMLYSCALLRRYEICFLHGLTYAEDVLFRHCCVYLADKIRLIDQPLYLHRSNPAGAMHVRKFGIDHLSGIVKGYLKAEELLRPYESLNRGSADYLRVMAAIYTLSMIEEHYAHFGSASKLSRFLEQNPEFIALIEAVDLCDLSESHQRLLRLYRTAPGRFRCGCYVSGLKRLLRERLKACAFLVNKAECTRFSIPNQYL